MTGKDSNKVAAKSAHKAPTKSKAPVNVKAVSKAQATVVKAKKVAPKPGTATVKKGGGATNKVPVRCQTRLQAKNGNIDMNDPDSEAEGTGKAPADGDDYVDDEGENHIPLPKLKKITVSPPGQSKLEIGRAHV